MFCGGIREWTVCVAEAITACEKKERRGKGVTIQINSAILYSIIFTIMQGHGEVIEIHGFNMNFCLFYTTDRDCLFLSICYLEIKASQLPCISLLASIDGDGILDR